MSQGQIASQVDQLGSQGRVEFEPFPAHGQEQQRPGAVFLPRVCHVAQQVEGGFIDPVQIL